MREHQLAGAKLPAVVKGRHTAGLIRTFISLFQGGMSPQQRAVSNRGHAPSPGRSGLNQHMQGRPLLPAAAFAELLERIHQLLGDGQPRPRRILENREPLIGDEKYDGDLAQWQHPAGDLVEHKGQRHD